jgi:hypothetical protein
MIHHKKEKEIDTIKEVDECSSISSDTNPSEEEKKTSPTRLKLVYKRSATRVDRTVQEFENMTPAENKIYQRVTSVLSQAKTFKDKIKAMEEEKNDWNTRDLEDYIMKNDEVSSPTKSMSCTSMYQKNRKLTV